MIVTPPIITYATSKVRGITSAVAAAADEIEDGVRISVDCQQHPIASRRPNDSNVTGRLSFRDLFEGVYVDNVKDPRCFSKPVQRIKVCSATVIFENHGELA